ncbi:MAG: YebC/PmpR family DNA-binding transcriptional regulator [Acidimicrobiales bacterium]|jgi:YebC/PmpR family DNA-binding regulatory protein|nr:YebC/PmpR family DNA-binding transcriptional regulator [Actinomycetota bacterium]MDA8184490.1 YebC/PmpR family DNA-binding transcriptional regulator [Actinomycetota bacterium]
MSGHSKWATTKHRKAAVDKARAKLFAKLIRQIEVAAREGGGDLDANPTLRTMFDKARSASVPADTIERAVKRGTGELEGVRYEPVSYEGYAPGGVAVIVECLTDNRNRTGAEIRNIFSRNGGSTAEPGAVAWQFSRKGMIVLGRDADEDAIMEAALDAGAEDLVDEEDRWELVCAPQDMAAVRSALEAAGFTPLSADLALVATTVVPVSDDGEARRVLRLVEALDDHDDVQAVWSNFDISDEVLAAAAES